MNSFNIAVVGAGIFGSTAAVKLCQKGYKVDLYEKGRDIFCAASGINQYRLHRGYHYPRSISTAVSSRDAEISFITEYRDAVVRNIEEYYAISKRNSMTDRNHYLNFCAEVNLDYEETKVDVLHDGTVSLIIRAYEYLFDPIVLKNVCKRNLEAAGVVVHLDTPVNAQMLGKYDFIVNATYASLNSLLDDYPASRREYQFEVCEKPVVRLPEAYRGKSVVVLDGPFMCFDPYGTTGLFVLGNVVHAIHQTNVGEGPEVDPALVPYLNDGIITNPPITKFPLFVESASEYFVDFHLAEHVGSMFTVRTVLPRHEATDDRPTVVELVGEGLINIFSGKIGNCVVAAEQTVELVESSLNSGVGRSGIASTSTLGD